MSVNLAQRLAKLVVVLLAHGVEFLMVVDGDDSHSAFVLDLDNLVFGHGGQLDLL